MLKTDFNTELLNIWEVHNSHYTELVPQFYAPFERNKTLFVGLNPSFSENGYRGFLKNTNYSHWLDNLIERFSIDYFKKTNSLVDDYIAIENLSKKNYPYYKTFNRITDNWTYIDLFNFRVTQQTKLKSIYSPHNNFFSAQVKVTLSLIEEIEPEVIIVANAFASDLIMEATKPIFVDDWGTFQLFGRPIFFSGMLSGTGAIDKGAFRRLQWHYNFVKSKT